MSASSDMGMQMSEMSIKVFLGAGVTGGTPAYSLRYCIGVQETGTDQEKVEEAGSLFKF